MDIKILIRPHLLNIKPYSSARDEYSGKEGVFLDANENPFGSATQLNFNRYPDPYQLNLKKRIAAIKNVDREKIFLGNGSDEPIDLIIRAFCEPGNDNIITTVPTYGMYKVSAAVNNVENKEVPLTKDYQLDPNALFDKIDKNTKLIFLCSPNNPTGNSLEQEQIIEVIQQFNGLVIIDEAYIDFSEKKSCTELLDRYQNLVVLQTFSKAWGMAALRLGMAFASKQIIDILNQIKPPYNVNGATQQFALEALENEAWKNSSVEKILKLREALKTALNKVSCVQKIYPTDANFLFVKVDNAKKVFTHLIDHKIIVRDRSKVVLCEGCLRITVGTEEENNALIETLKKYKS